MKGAKDNWAKMAKLSGKEFDKSYAANELAYHQTVNTVVGDAFIPNVENGELKTLLGSALSDLPGAREACRADGGGHRIVTSGTSSAGSALWSRRSFFIACSMASFVRPARAEATTVEIHQFKFAPAEIEVAAGATVTFSNLDLVPHTATGDGFDTGTLQEGRKQGDHVFRGRRLPVPLHLPSPHEGPRPGALAAQCWRSETGGCVRSMR